MDKTTMLARVPLFAHLDKRSLARLATMLDEVDVDAGTVLMTEGRSGREFFASSKAPSTSPGADDTCDRSPPVTSSVRSP